MEAVHEGTNTWFFNKECLITVIVLIFVIKLRTVLVDQVYSIVHHKCLNKLLTPYKIINDCPLNNPWSTNFLQVVSLTKLWVIMINLNLITVHFRIDIIPLADVIIINDELEGLSTNTDNFAGKWIVRVWLFIIILCLFVLLVKLVVYFGQIVSGGYLSNIHYLVFPLRVLVYFTTFLQPSSPIPTPIAIIDEVHSRECLILHFFQYDHTRLLIHPHDLVPVTAIIKLVLQFLNQMPNILQHASPLIEFANVWCDGLFEKIQSWAVDLRDREKERGCLAVWEYWRECWL